MINSIKIILSIALPFLFSFQSHADDALADSLLWEVSGKNLTQPSYITGTLHIMCGKDFGILPKVEKAIKSTDQLYLELNFNDPKEMANMQKMMFSDTLLTETLSEGQQLTLSKVLKDAMNLTIEQVNNYSMNTLFSMLLVSSVECPSGQKFLDMELSALAVSEGKAVGGLETVQAQLEFFNKAFSTDFMLKQFELMPAYMGVLDQMVSSFNAEDLNTLMDLLEDERFYNEDVGHWLLEVRNKNWVKEMPEIMQANSTVFAVGAGHLLGENGVIQLLKNAGYSVQPVLD